MQHQAQETEEHLLQQVQLQMKAENLAAQRAVSYMGLSAAAKLFATLDARPSTGIFCMLSIGASAGPLVHMFH
jgi:hypothetical protein